MIFVDEMKNLTLYKRPFFLPINEKDRKHGNVSFLLTPNYNSSKNILNSNMIINRNYESYYIEKDITYFINQEGYTDIDNRGIINETLEVIKSYSPGRNIALEESLYYREKDENDDIRLYANTDIETGTTLSGIKNSSIPHYIGRSSKDGNIIVKDGEFITTKPIKKHDKLVLISRDGITESYHVGYLTEDARINSSHIRGRVDCNDVMIFFNENLNEEILNEAAEYNTVLHKILFNERFKNNSEVFGMYDKVKQDLPWIKKTYIDYAKYNQLNLIVDLSFYNQTFFKNNFYKLDKAVDLYFEFITRFIKDKRLANTGYNKKTVFVPLTDWSSEDVAVYNFNETINPLSMIVRMMKIDKLSKIKSEWKDITFVFMNERGYFKVDFNELDEKDVIQFTTLINKLKDKSAVISDPEGSRESTKAIVATIIDNIEYNQKIKINNLTGKGGEIEKDELVKKIEKAAATSGSTSDTIDALEEDDTIKKIIANLAAEEDNSVKINKARASRLTKLDEDFMNKKLNNVSVRDMITMSNTQVEIPTLKLEIDTVNEEWKELNYPNFETIYKPEQDILAMLQSLSSKTVPVAIRELNVEDTSTSEDYVETWTVQMEDVNGSRFTLKFDIPKFKDNKFLLLRGNEKTVNGQLVLMPIIKTDEDTVQVVTNYNKIFIERFGTSKGKSFIIADKIIKALNKFDKFKVSTGDLNRICSKYELPIDYIDLAGQFAKIETKKYIIFFNQDEIREKYKVDLSKGLPIAIEKSTNSITYYSWDTLKITCSELIYSILLADESGFGEVFDSVSKSSKYTYSKASILNTHIPLVVLMAYNEGLTKVLKKANIKYELMEKKPKFNANVNDVIKFNDGYLMYELNYNSSLLMNGLKECNTEDYSLNDINGKTMYLDFLDLFGGRLKADGLDNFYDLLIDPITEEILMYYKLPTDYIEILAYANALLADNKFIKHTDMSGRRYRSNEIVAGYFYQALADSYGDYRNKLKKTDKATMTMKQSEVIDRVLLDPTASDLSVLNPLLEWESINAVTFKGLVGMNSDRSYDLDKRTFDKSMINVLGMSTGFAGNVGITRQATIDMNIEGRRGYIKTVDSTDTMGVTKTLCATEALTPFGTTRDDPFRTAMTFIQTSKHGMRVKNGTPLLITNGADEAMPYLITNTFAFKAKEDGKVIEKTDDYIIIKYKDGNSDFIDLRANIKKNSNGGFYTSVKLDSNVRAGQVIKKNQILAYDKLSFSDKIGHNDNIAYNIGVLVKVALMNTDEGFEDSAIISPWLSDAMASEVVVQKHINLPKNTNIYNMVKKGQPIQEGEPLLIFQNAFEEDDVNLLLKNLVDDEEAISELGRIRIKSKITGMVEDIKAYRTVEKEEMSDSLKKKFNELEKPIGDMKKIMKKYDIEYANRFDADYKLDSTGKLKNIKDGVLIEFYLKYEDKMSVGDKLIYFSALKGVVKDIFPAGKEPYTDFRPKEIVHSLLSLGSVNGRMVCSVKINMAINKVLIELDRKCKEIAGIPFKYLDEE